MPFEMDSTISIHAPRKGGDLSSPLRCGPAPYFNPRPREGGDSAWLCYLFPVVAYFNPRPPRGGRLPDYKSVGGVSLFQSTPPARGATNLHRRSQCKFMISIHAPREGGDRDFKSMDKRVVISIHAPREGGDGGERMNLLDLFVFQSTPPARGATALLSMTVT